MPQGKVKGTNQLKMWFKIKSTETSCNKMWKLCESEILKVKASTLIDEWYHLAVSNVGRWVAESNFSGKLD